MAEAGEKPPSLIRRLRNSLRPRLRTILIGLNLAVLILPLGSIFFFRIYENQLVQETERELIAQAAFISALYESEIETLTTDSDYGHKVSVSPETRLNGRSYGSSAQPVETYYTPIDPQLDLAAVDILPPRPAGYYLRTPPDPIAEAVGARLTPILRQAQRTTLSGMRVLDYNGIVVAGGGEFGKSFIHVTEVQRALSGHYASVVRVRFLDQVAPPVASISRSTGIRVFIVMPVMRGENLLGFVYLSRTPKSILKHMHAEREKIIFAGLTIVGMSILLAFLTSSRISRPINQLIERTRRLASGDKTAIAPLDRPGTLEMTQLSQSFSQMASALQERSDYIRDFAAHVSHEFKTPLASIAGAVELLRDHGADMSDQDRDRFLDNITQDTDRLRRLVTRLLELARVDNLEPSAETLDIAEALNVMKSGFTGPAFTMEVDAPQPVMAAVSRDGFEMIVSNMADNARQHGASRMSVSATSDGDGVELRFADDGEGISPANRAKIFTPFFTTRREDGGTGLGLGIVSSILDAHDGSIELADKSEGTEFVVRLKKAA
jgi:signal transduction histidine kinase